MCSFLLQVYAATYLFIHNIRSRLNTIDTAVLTMNGCYVNEAKVPHSGSEFESTCIILATQLNCLSAYMLIALFYGSATKTFCATMDLLFQKQFFYLLYHGIVLIPLFSMGC